MNLSSISSNSAQQYTPIQDTLNSSAPPFPPLSPSTHAELVSLHSEALHISDKFESLVHRGKATGILQTPVQLFGMIPTQSLQMGFGVSQLLGVGDGMIKIAAGLSKQSFLGLPVFQRAFQMLFTQMQSAGSVFAKGLLGSSQSVGKSSVGQINAQNSVNQTQKVATQKPQEATSEAKAPKKSSKGFFGKLRSAFSKIGKVFSKIMDFASPFLKFIPGVGTAIAAGWSIAKGLFQSIKGAVKGNTSNSQDLGNSASSGSSSLNSAKMGVVEGLKNFLGKAPKIGAAVSSIASKIGSVFPKILSFFK